MADLESRTDEHQVASFSRSEKFPSRPHLTAAKERRDVARLEHIALLQEEGVTGVLQYAEALNIAVPTLHRLERDYGLHIPRSKKRRLPARTSDSKKSTRPLRSDAEIVAEIKALIDAGLRGATRYQNELHVSPKRFQRIVQEYGIVMPRSSDSHVEKEPVEFYSSDIEPVRLPDRQVIARESLDWSFAEYCLQQGMSRSRERYSRR